MPHREYMHLLVFIYRKSGKISARDTGAESIVYRICERTWRYEKAMYIESILRHNMWYTRDQLRRFISLASAQGECLYIWSDINLFSYIDCDTVGSYHLWESTYKANHICVSPRRIHLTCSQSHPETYRLYYYRRHGSSKSTILDNTESQKTKNWKLNSPYF